MVVIQSCVSWINECLNMPIGCFPMHSETQLQHTRVKCKMPQVMLQNQRAAQLEQRLREAETRADAGEQRALAAQVLAMEQKRTFDARLSEQSASDTRDRLRLSRELEGAQHRVHASDNETGALRATIAALEEQLRKKEWLREKFVASTSWNQQREARCRGEVQAKEAEIEALKQQLHREACNRDEVRNKDAEIEALRQQLRSEARVRGGLEAKDAEIEAKTAQIEALKQQLQGQSTQQNGEASAKFSSSTKGLDVQQAQNVLLIRSTDLTYRLEKLQLLVEELEIERDAAKSGLVEAQTGLQNELVKEARLQKRFDAAIEELRRLEGQLDFHIKAGAHIEKRLKEDMEVLR